MGNYIVFDLEWNQASTKEKEVKEIMFEILEIGAVKLNEKMEIVDTFSSLVRPQVYRTMHYMTQKIVHLDIHELDREDVFPDVIRRFLKWCEDDPVFCTWGNLDLTQLQSNLAYYHMKPISKGPLPYLDVQKLFSLCYEDGKLRRSLEYGANYLNLKLDLEFHRALSDAYYTAEIFGHLDKPEVLKYVSYDVFHLPKTREEEIFVNFGTYTKYISREFFNKNMAIADREVSATRCTVCRKNAKREGKWFSNNGKHYYCVAQCREHGFLKAKARIKKTDGDKVYVVKTMKMISPEDAQAILEKRKKKDNLHFRK